MKRDTSSLLNHGVSLPENVLTQLDNLGIYAQPALRKRRQPLRNRMVLIGEESGGAAVVRNGVMSVHVGRYVTFADEAGNPLPHIKLLASLGGSGRHASVLAPVLLRIELYRVNETCQLLVTRHEVDQSKPYRVHSSIVFRGVDGTVDLERLRQKRQYSFVLPEFLSSSLDSELEIPRSIRGAVAAATLGSICVRCAHSHFTTDSLPAEPSDVGTSVKSVSAKDVTAHTPEPQQRVTPTIEEPGVRDVLSEPQTVAS